MRNARFEVTDKAIGVCAIDFRPIHKEKCIAYVADLFCKHCLQEMLALALEHGLVELPKPEAAEEAAGAPAEGPQAQAPAQAWLCPVCGKEFGSQQALAAHARTHKGGGF